MMEVYHLIDEFKVLKASLSRPICNADSHITLPGRLNKNSGSLYAQPTRLKAINGDEFGNFQDGATSITAKDLVAGLTYIWQADKRTLPHPKTQKQIFTRRYMITNWDRRHNITR